MKNQKIIGVVFVIIVIVGVLMYMKFTKNTDSDRSDVTANASTTADSTGAKMTLEQIKKQSNTYLAQDGVYVIKYTTDGFVPKDIQIPRGKSVRFINMTDTGMRIISDNTDPKFAGLTEAKTIGKGATYTFTFSEVGLWVYHNQSTPNMKATILINQF